MIQIGAKPDSGFDDPIGMLKDCHRRIERYLHILCLVAKRAQRRTLTQEESAAITSALDYFRIGGQRHNADEEESLFPRLRVQTDTNAQEALVKIDSLEIDHRTADYLHTLTGRLYEAWIEHGSLSAAENRQLLDATQRLAQLYKAHIALEEEVVFPLAGSLLDGDALGAIGEEFRKRRIEPSALIPG